MNGMARAQLRLLAVQGAWSYERMQGVGMGYAAEPMLDDLEPADPARHAEAVARSAEFFNAHPYLVGLALGATVRAEYDAVPGERIARLRRALCSPLGALGDQLFWAGLVPALAAAALVGVALGAGLWAAAAFLLVFNVVRILTVRWALRTGLAAGMDVGKTIASSWLPRAAGGVGPVAGFAVGLALPVAGGWLLAPFGMHGLIGALGVTLAATVLTRLMGQSLTMPRVAMLILGATLLLRLVTT